MLSADADADDLTSDSHPKQNGDDMPPSPDSIFLCNTPRPRALSRSSIRGIATTEHADKG
jgi:hypothetical protein